VFDAAALAPALGPALGADPVVALAYLLLALGVVGSLLPLPGALASLAGLYLYWWRVGRPGALALALLTLAGLVALAADWLGGPLAARLGGARTRTVALGGLAGLAGLVVAGPVGFVLGLVGTVFLLEYDESADAAGSARAAAFAAAGVLASAGVQLLATTAVLVGVWLAG
jgi:hypothetical protein